MVTKVQALASTWQPWTWNGYNKFPTLYFAANPNGYFSSATLDKIHKFDIAMIEFRHGQHNSEGWANGVGEEYSRGQCQAIKQHKANPPPCIVYRSGLWAGYYYTLQNAYLNTQSRFISPDVDGECAEEDGFANFAETGRTVCKWDFTQSGVRSWYGNTMLNEIASESYVDGVFIDNGQSLGCDGVGHVSTLTADQRAGFLNDQLQAYKAGFQALANAGKYSILSTTNQFPQPKGDIVNFENNCGNTEANIINTLSGIPFARNYEFFMWQTGDMCSSQILNFIKETQQGIPVFVHVPFFQPNTAESSTGGCHEACYLPSVDEDVIKSYTRTTFLKFTMAAFLIGMGPGSYFGFSEMNSPCDTIGLGGWADCSWPYYNEFDLIPGTPIGDPVVSANKYRFTRSFTNIDVMVDCNTGDASITPRPTPSSSVPTKAPTTPTTPTTHIPTKYPTNYPSSAPTDQPTVKLWGVSFTAVYATLPCSETTGRELVTEYNSLLAARLGVVSYNTTYSCGSIVLHAWTKFTQKENAAVFYNAIVYNTTATFSVLSRGAPSAIQNVHADYTGVEDKDVNQLSSEGMLYVYVAIVVVVAVLVGACIWYWKTCRRKSTWRSQMRRRSTQGPGRKSSKHHVQTDSEMHQMRIFGIEATAKNIVNNKMSSPPDKNTLPEGWTQEFTDDGVPYYFNRFTGDSRWEMPTVFAARV